MIHSVVRTDDRPFAESIKRQANKMQQEAGALGKRKQPDKAVKSKKPTQVDGLGTANAETEQPLQPTPQTRPQPQRERAAKKAKKPTHDDRVGHSSDQPQPQPQLRQPHPQTHYPQHEELIDISSSSEDENQPSKPKLVIPKIEEATLPTEEIQTQPSQAVVEVVNIFPTQEVIDLSSSPEEDRQQPLVPKEEHDVETSTRSQIISSVLVSIRLDHQPIEAPSFDLGVEEPPLTTQTMEAIDEIDEQLRKNPDLLRTPDPLGAHHILADMERRVAVWGTIPKGDNEFMPIFKLKVDKCLEALRYQFKSMAPEKYIYIQVVSIMCHILNRTSGERYQNLIYCVPLEILQRMFEKYGHQWQDVKTKKPHDIRTLLNHK
ncbi:hypothetical protein PIB30_071986 [Stylosanthes scabra]|uniref:Uncharacterized protein n=1 Tax=Stylosanthes scabra TaxID=79078 RepID=A0ABU6VMC9_9FABA|nr:hypothetical protein [Stylosanthes scabra]